MKPGIILPNFNNPIITDAEKAVVAAAVKEYGLRHVLSADVHSEAEWNKWEKARNALSNAVSRLLRERRKG